MLRLRLGNGEPLCPAPFRVAVRPGAASALKLRAPPHTPQCGETYGPIAVWPVDAQGNPAAGVAFEPCSNSDAAGTSMEVIDVAWREVDAEGQLTGFECG